ncbi:glycosyltransferase [Hoyosella altamirensis]|uniref:Alpha-1,6-mannosyltransferase n=1 Tax=Hoyosella altamirensis TaxID=616997 RepID=A0A839RIY1_9ACTN|nr:glycosyltransferase [Hoyosella altamirensis]MBB3036134.1 alpha-1,6-mannosyltransferase [Hoyosella altamirensis]
MRIVQLANFYGPRSGGLRTALNNWGAAYAAVGHDVTIVVPGPRDLEEVLPCGVRRITLASLLLPRTGGYRVADPRRVADVLRGVAPDAVEVSDRLTLRGFGRWARKRGIPSVVVSHERLDRLLGQIMPVQAAQRLANTANAHMARDYDTVVCTTEFAAAEFRSIDATNVRRVPLGVDTHRYHPALRSEEMHRRLMPNGGVLLVHSGRLSVEKHVERSIDATRALHYAGYRVRLVIAGDGPRRERLERRARGIPVTFSGFIDDQQQLATLLATADVSLAPGPHETFCLSALESLASGTPVVASHSSALHEIITLGCGAVAADTDGAFADAIAGLVQQPRETLRASARARAEQFGWGASAAGMLDALTRTAGLTLLASVPK